MKNLCSVAAVALCIAHMLPAAGAESDDELLNRIRLEREQSLERSKMERKRAMREYAASQRIQGPTGLKWIAIPTKDSAGRTVAYALSQGFVAQEVSKAWLRWSFATEQEIGNGIPYFSIVVLTAYRCQAREEATLQLYFYSEPNAEGIVVWKEVTPTEKASFVDPVPGSLSEVAMNGVCAALRRK